MSVPANATIMAVEPDPFSDTMLSVTLRLGATGPTIVVKVPVTMLDQEIPQQEAAIRARAKVALRTESLVGRTLNI